MVTRPFTAGWPRGFAAGGHGCPQPLPDSSRAPPRARESWSATQVRSDAGPMNLPASLNAIAAEQIGVVSRRQLVENGVSIGQLRWQLGRTWRQLLPGVVLPALHCRRRLNG